MDSFTQGALLLYFKKRFCERQFSVCHLNDDPSLLSCDEDGRVYRSTGFGIGADM